MKTMRALITGVTGFTGRYLAQTLTEAGYEVHGLTAHPESAGGTIYACDLVQARERLAALFDTMRPDVVVHLAAISYVAHGQRDAIYQVNLLGTLHLLEALAASSRPPNKILLASSGNVYGNATSGVIDETSPLAPANDYAVSKVAMEMSARLWFDRLPILITRPFNYTGAGQAEHFLLPKIVAHFARGATEILLGNTDVARDFSDVRTVAAIYRELLEKGQPGEVYNVCSGLSYRLDEILELMAEIAGYRIRVHTDPALVRSNEVKCLTGSNAKLRTCLGTWPEYPLRDTLAWMYQTLANTSDLESKAK